MKTKGAPPADYYALLGLDERYHIRARELEERYLERSKRVHPDRFVNAPTSERVAALQQSMLLNDAYRTLADPLARAEYLLARNGIGIADNERLEPRFLMEVLELREELAEAKHAGDKQTLRRLEHAMLGRRDQALEHIGELFRALYRDGENPAGQPDAAELLAAVKERVIVLRYIKRYLHELDDAFDDEESIP